MAGKFEIGKDKSGKFRFHLKAANGEIIAASQGYETRKMPIKALSRSKTSVPAAKVVDLTEREPAHNQRISPFIPHSPRICGAWGSGPRKNLLGGTGSP